MPRHELVFPLVPRHRLLGLAFGAMPSARRGLGSDIAGSRPYRPGDDVHAIDWNASARLSSARGTDEFVVRERYAEDAPRVVVVCDRRPGMELFPPGLPWLSKREVLHSAGELIGASTARVRGFVGYLDYAEGEPFWRPPRSQREAGRLEESHLLYPAFRAPEDNVERALDYLGERRRALPAGTFVFVLSDFLAPPPPETWLRALEHRWDVVPVVIQDPVWEQSFPDVGGIGIPILDAATGRVETLRLSGTEARARRAHNEQRLRALREGLVALGLEPIVLSSPDPREVLEAFLEWADQRRYLAGREGRLTA
ncbi:MAG: DUF58 domain-containing protein [Thermoleophilia bacterium]|nr:DUF58 domain-containing protein [Thermoleophilia bacterium]